jgi:hypothetical protein
VKLSAILAPLIAAGVSGDVILATVKAFEDQQTDALEKRREADRIRQDRKRQSDKSRDVTLRHSDSLLVRDRVAPGDVKQINLETPNSKKEEDADKPLSDLAGFKAELAQVLSPERIDAIVSLRRKKKAPITPYAARLLVKALNACPDVNAAADEMIVRNWTSIKPEWLEARNSSRATGPPQPTLHQQRHQAAINAFARHGKPQGDHTDDEFAGSTIDLGERDYRSNRAP